jgi:hypothetical protein
VKERKKIKELMDQYGREKESSNELKQYFQDVGWAGWREKEFFI